ncbi:mast/stem cell growth factor receptor kita-like [Paramacrobiotus metropolitanus]|uniref:mast/stem cell growth factor receptor kita-like n=1 Tax=Paramacrobiotus metropolitanus TaxID=2943436 RepID=UPI0024462234|nr:mast/stem cell growth factor receptor kita-like [Paramacrobiotus metropolitanus]
MTPLCPEVAIISRKAWGARDVRVTEMDMLPQPATCMVFTHSYGARCFDARNCSLITQAMQTYNMDTNKRPDIFYNFLIGYDGSVFEGRGRTYRPTVNWKYNAYSLGVAFIGKYPPSGDDFTKLSYQAAVSASALLQCARSQGWLDANNHSVTTFRINPIMRKYILNPSLLLPLQVPAQPAKEPQAFRDGFIAGSIMALLIGLILLCVVYCRGKQQRENYKHFCRAANYREELLKTVPSETVDYFTIPRRSIDIKDEHLGSGRDGHVFVGALHSKELRRSSWSSTDTSVALPVAVKMLRELSANGPAASAFLSEMAVLMKVGRHTNIVNLEGVVLQGKLMMVMEHCELLSLDCYLHTLRTSTESVQSEPYSQDPNHQASTVIVQELNSFVYQISRGMEFLSNKSIIHRDLAARNVLLDAQKTAKIADFGMAKELPVYTLERDKVPLPVRWLAPECLQPNRAVFSTASDVWSFGVIVWEIFTFGSEPYAVEFPNGILYDQLCEFLRQGSRLNLPEICPTEIRQMAMGCWEFEPERRPSFSTIHRRAEAVLPVSTKDVYVTCDVESCTPNDQSETLRVILNSEMPVIKIQSL